MGSPTSEKIDLRYGVVVPHLGAWRLARGISQAKLARYARLSRETVRAAELGRPIRRTHVAVLARVIGTTYQRLVESKP